MSTSREVIVEVCAIVDEVEVALTESDIESEIAQLVENIESATGGSSSDAVWGLTEFMTEARSNLAEMIPNVLSACQRTRAYAEQFLSSLEGSSEFPTKQADDTLTETLSEGVQYPLGSESIE